MSSNIFSALKVIDAASFLAGPCAATIFSDYGADVIKIEPLKGDGHRSIAGSSPSDYSWQLTDRNRRGLALNIAKPAGYEILINLIKDADVFVVNFTTEQLQRYQLDWPTLHAINPKLVFAQITAYGMVGPEAEKKGFDLTGWFARTGILDMMRDKGNRPSLPAGGVGDHVTAMTLFGGIMTALYQRQQTGVGAMVSTSLAGTGAWANALNLQGVMGGVDESARRDLEGWSNPVKNVYVTRDGQNLLLILQQIARDWPKLVAALGKPEWLEDDKLQMVKPFFKNRHYAKALINKTILEFDAADLYNRFEDHGVIYAQIEKNADVINDEQLILNKVIVESDSGKPGGERTFATPFQVSSNEQLKPQRAPRIGEHSIELLQAQGFDDEAIATLVAQGIVGVDNETSP